MRPPKDLDKYIPSWVAAVRKNSKAIAVPTRGTFGSGDYEEKSTVKPATEASAIEA